MGNLKKVYGHLSIDSKFIEHLGELNYVKTDFWYHEKTLKSLGNLIKIGGSMNLRYSNIESLGELQRVGGNLSLRDTKIKDLGKLNYVGGNLYLPKRLEGINLENIHVKGQIRFWNDKKTSKVEILKNNFNWDVNDFFSSIHSRELQSKKKHLTGEYLVKRCFGISEYNDYILDNLNDFILFVEKHIKNLYQGKFSFYDSLYGQIKTIDEINDEFPKIKFDKRINRNDRFDQLNKLANKYISENTNNYPLKKYKKVKREFKSDDDWNGKSSKIWLRYDEHKLSKSEYSCHFTWDPYKGENDFQEGFIYFIENILLQTFSILIDSLQNKFRVSMGLPKIGEGWISETDLYYKLKEHFSGTQVIHHGKPKWLGKQHVDIWFPKYKIGVEYQGAQHHQPVDFFGGKESFLKNQERDLRKKKLFEENNATLIEVLPKYVLEDVINEIEIQIQN